MENKSLIKKFANYAIPSVAAMWVFSIYTMVDGFFVAKYVGSNALSAVNLSMPFVNTMFAMAIIFGVGTSTAVGVLLGKNKVEDAKKTFSMTSLVLIIFALFLVIFSRIFMGDIVEFLGATEHTREGIIDYISIILWFIPFFMISYHFEILVKIDGFPRLATWGVLSSALTNIILDYIFVGLMGYGISGAAIATGLAQILSTMIFTLHFLKKLGKLSFVKFFFVPKELFRILPLGFGDFLSEFSTGFIVFLHNRIFLETLGEESIVSYTVVSYVNLLVAMTMVGVTQGMQPLMSYYFGKDYKHTCKRLLRYTISVILGLSVLAIFLVLILGSNISEGFIGENPQLARLTTEALQKYSFSFLFLGINLMLIGYFASIERASNSIRLSVLRGFIMISIALILLKSIDPQLLWYGALLSELGSFIYGLYLFSKLNREPLKA